jgi:hypothetical protein
MNYKWLILVVVVSVELIMGTMVMDANAQTETQPTNTGESNKRGEVGARFMPTFSAFQLKNAEGQSVKGRIVFGYGFGVLGAFNFSKHVGVQGEIIYNAISQKYKEQDSEHRVNLRYVNIPLLLSLNTGKTNRVNVNVVVGPQVGISVGGEVKTNGNSDLTTAEPLIVVKQGDLGLAYGAGIDFGLNSARTFRLGIGFRGVYGFFDISDDSQDPGLNNYYALDRAHIKTYSAYAGFSFLF